MSAHAEGGVSEDFVGAEEVVAGLRCGGAGHHGKIQSACDVAIKGVKTLSRSLWVRFITHHLGLGRESEGRLRIHPQA